MDSISLLNSTGNQKGDDILRGTIGIFEIVFPNRIRGYYLTGSYANGYALPTSDIDMTVVFKGSFIDSEEEKKVEQIYQHCELISSIRLDLKIFSEEKLFHLGADSRANVQFIETKNHLVAVVTKINSLLIYGENIRDKISLPPVDRFVWDFMYLTYYHFAGMRKKPTVLTFPLTYPNPEQEFYGYTEFHGYGYTVKRTTVFLVYTIGLAAMAIIALKAGKYVGNKEACLSAYKACINDQWTGFVEEVFEKCRNRWEYHIPDNKEERRQLREICKQTLAFENHFLTIYKNYLLTELRDADDGDKLLAVKRLGEIIYSRLRKSLMPCEPLKVVITRNCKRV